MTTVELDFSVLGQTTLAADHSYPLYSALSKVLPAVHKAEWLGIHTMPGLKDGRGNIKLIPEPRLSLRLPVDKVPVVYPLAGKRVVVDEHTLRLGIPRIRVLQPGTDLWARLVTLKLAGSEGQTAEAQSFLEGVRRQMETMGIQAEVSLEVARDKAELDPYARRVLRIKGRTITGYGVHVSGLSDEDSLKLQAEGIGGRRRMGCGLFVPVQERAL